MFPISSTNHHTHIEPSWKTYYDAKKLLRQTEQRLQNAREYYPHVHYNVPHETSDLSSSSFSLHPETSSIQAGNRSMLNDERTINNNNNKQHQLLDSEALHTIRRKINKQKLAAGNHRSMMIDLNQIDCFCSRTSCRTIISFSIRCWPYVRILSSTYDLFDISKSTKSSLFSTSTTTFFTSKSTGNVHSTSVTISIVSRRT